MSKFCTYCGAQLGDSIKVCPDCGRLVGIENSKASEAAHQRREAARRVYEHPKRVQNRQVPQQGAVRTKQRPVQRPPQQRRPESEQAPRRPRSAPEQMQHTAKKKKSGVGSLVWRIAKKVLLIGIIVGIIYGVLAFAMISLTKKAGYDFSDITQMQLEQDSYGEAIDVYFKDGSWSFNMFTFTVSYTGTAHNGDDYVMKFGHEKGKTVVTDMKVNGKKINQKDIMPLYVMGMFNSVEIKTNK